MKLIKFDLPINGTKVKNLDELRDNLTDEILMLARSSQLERWLRTRQLPEKAQAVATAVRSEGTDKGLFLALCKVLEVEVHPDDVKAIFDAPPAPGRFISGARYFVLYEELKKSLDKKEETKISSNEKNTEVPPESVWKKISDLQKSGFGNFSAPKKIRNVKFDSELLDVKLVNELILGGGCGHTKNVFVKQGSVVLKGSLIAEIGVRSSIIRIHAPVAGVVEEVSVEVGRSIRIGGDVCAIAEKQA
jgi:biotin carboxyl carrier protein